MPLPSAPVRSGGLRRISREHGTGWSRIPAAEREIVLYAGAGIGTGSPSHSPARASWSRGLTKPGARNLDLPVPSGREGGRRRCRESGHSGYWRTRSAFDTAHSRHRRCDRGRTWGADPGLPGWRKTAAHSYRTLRDQCTLARARNRVGLPGGAFPVIADNRSSTFCLRIEERATFTPSPLTNGLGAYP